MCLMVLVFYCSVKNYHTYSSLKTHTHLLCSDFHGLGNWVCCSGFYNSTNALAGLYSFLELGAFLSVGRFLSIMVVGLTEASIFFLATNQRPLSSSESAPFLATCPCHNMIASRPAEQLLLQSAKRVLYEITYSRAWLLMVFAISYWLAASQRFYLHSSGEGLHKGLTTVGYPRVCQIGGKISRYCHFGSIPLTHMHAHTYRHTPQEHPTWYLPTCFHFNSQWTFLWQKQAKSTKQW